MCVLNIKHLIDFLQLNENRKMPTFLCPTTKPVSLENIISYTGCIIFTLDLYLRTQDNRCSQNNCIANISPMILSRIRLCICKDIL